jgi:dTDP-4-amino-4,6-dideoxygalactose transaminase
MIPVTKPFLPPQQEYIKFLDGIWDRQWLTNNGPLVNDLELKLKEYLSVPHLLFLNNGTIALQIAIKALRLKGEIITTPFSYVATTSSIMWEGCKPVFVDINKQTFNIDPSKIEDAITEKTTAILATHVFGNPCEVESIQAIAGKHHLKVVYDAAHCFGTQYKGKSIFQYGDISTTSFHATKLFHTVEGGAVFSSDSELIKEMALLRNFGHYGPEDFAAIGINGKNSEFHAAMGLANLKYADSILATRKRQCEYYTERLVHSSIERIKIESNAVYNYAYYPILFENEQILLRVVKELNANRIFPRRYFYPSLNSVSIFNGQPMHVSEDVSKRILCLPLYFELSDEEIGYISRIILRTLSY